MKPWTIHAVIVRMRSHEPTIAYVAKRTADRFSEKDIIRRLKRYLVRGIYQPLPDTRGRAEPTLQAKPPGPSPLLSQITKHDLLGKPRGC